MRERARRRGKLVFDHLSTGAADDLAKVTDIARRMVMRFGMDERLTRNLKHAASPKPQKAAAE